MLGHRGETSGGPSAPPHHRRGIIRVRNLRLDTAIVGDAWGRKGKSQPAEVSVTVWRGDGLREAAQADDCDLGVSYSLIAKEARMMHEWRDEFLTSAHQLLCGRLEEWGGDAVEVETFFPKGLLRGGPGAGWGIRTKRRQKEKVVKEQQQQQKVPDLTTSVTYFARNLRLPCVIGVNDHEREAKQDVVIGLELTRLHYFGHFGVPQFLMTIENLIQIVEQSNFKTVEALAYAILKYLGETKTWSRTTATVEKPHAISAIEGCGVEMTLDWTDQPIDD